MSTDVMELPQQAAAGLPQQAVAAPISPEQQAAWIGMAGTKNQVVADLTNRELAAQGLLHGVVDTHEAIDGALATYRKAHTEMVETRKLFTAQIDAGIIQPLMAFEKRVDPAKNEAYQSLSNRSLELRKIAAENSARQNNINLELGQFKAHCQNEFFRVAALYRQQLRMEIDNQYAYWLNEGAAPSSEQLAVHLSHISVPSTSKFAPRYITPEQMAEAYQTINQPDWPGVLAEMQRECDTVFANFTSDVANKSAAIAARSEQTAYTNTVETSAAMEETAINTLIATAEVVTLDTPRIKVTYNITIVESEQWAKTVMAAFITNLPRLAKYIRVKSWAKLTIGQMAEYLAKLATDDDIKANGLEYKTVEK